MKHINPDYIFETSWEVCNKVGGIYTVLSTRARTLQTAFGDHLCFICFIYAVFHILGRKDTNNYRK
jgi:hypothetical protein